MHSTLKQPTAHSVRLTTQKPSSLGHFPPSSSSLRLATTAPGSSHDSYWSLSVERLLHSALCAFGILPSRGFLRDKTSSVHPSTRTELCRQLQLDENYASQPPPLKASQFPTEQPPANPQGSEERPLISTCPMNPTRQNLPCFPHSQVCPNPARQPSSAPICKCRCGDTEGLPIAEQLGYDMLCIAALPSFSSAKIA